MRDLARSMFRFSWAMSVLGARQMAHLLSPGEGWDRSADSLDAVSDAASKEMGDTLEGYYKAGDRLQSGMVDTVSRMVEGDWSEPGKVMNDTWDELDRTWSGVKDDLEMGSDDGE